MLAWHNCNFQEIWTNIAKEPYMFCDFSGDSGPTVPLPLDPRELCKFSLASGQMVSRFVHLVIGILGLLIRIPSPLCKKKLMIKKSHKLGPERPLPRRNFLDPRSHD